MPFIRNLPSIALKCWYFPRYKGILVPPLPRIHDTPTPRLHLTVVTVLHHLVALYAHTMNTTISATDTATKAETCDIVFSHRVVFEMTLMLLSLCIDASFLSALSGIMDRGGMGVPQFYWTPPEHLLQYSSVWTDQCFRPGGWMDKRTWCDQCTCMRW